MNELFRGILASSSGAGMPHLPNFVLLLKERYGHHSWFDLLVVWEDVLISIFIAALISLIFYFGSRKKELIPSGLQNFLELTVDGLRKLILGVLGPDGEKHFPFLATLFVYILTMNLFGLIPFMKSPSSNLNITVALAICVFVRVQYLNFSNMGIGGYLYHMAGSPKDFVGWLMVPLMFPIELLTQFSRPVTLALRLFGNVMGEHILIGVFAVFGMSLVFFNLPFGIPLQTPFMLFGILTSLMQALVFTLLSTVYILLSTPHDEENNSHE
jgi:F-type H+-transporting ATPase subunit a